MQLQLLGINHKTAPLTLREQLAVLPHDLSNHLAYIKQLLACEEALILSTCNRTEIYLNSTSELKPQDLAGLLQLPASFASDNLTQHVYQLTGQGVVRHLLQVAVGLDSMFLGEAQILGQLKKAYQQALVDNMIGSQFHDLLQWIFNITKSIRNQSALGQYSCSVAAMMAKKLNANLRDTSDVLFIGSGETTKLMLKYLDWHKVNNIYLATRNPQHAKQITAENPLYVIDINNLNLYLPKVSHVVSATNCPERILSHAQIDNLQHQDNYQVKRFFYDLSVPRDIAPDVINVDNVSLISVDDLEPLLANNRAELLQAKIIAEALLDEALTEYQNRQTEQQHKDYVVDYRSSVQDLCAEELALALSRYQNGKPAEQVLAEFSHRLSNKIMHMPTQQIKRLGGSAHEIFKLQ